MSTAKSEAKINIEVPNPIVNDKSVVEYNETTDNVEMPLWYWKKILNYIIDTQEIM